MATRHTIKERAKKHEREVQQYLWPGSKFAGGAKRPALEDEDLRGCSVTGERWWGECKSRKNEIIRDIGVWKILSDAFDQCLEAAKRNEENVLIFSVLRKKGTSIESNQNLVMVEIKNLVHATNAFNNRIIIPLCEFKKIIVGE